MIKITPIIPKVTLDVLTDSFVKSVKEETEEADKQFAKTYATFRNAHKPDFSQEFNESKSEIWGQTVTSGDGSTDNPYPFIVGGTSKRYATMTPDFVAKTKRRVIGSGPGAGGLAYVDKRVKRKGIEAREFDKEIAKQEQPKFTKLGQDNLDAAARSLR